MVGRHNVRIVRDLMGKSCFHAVAIGGGYSQVFSYRMKLPFCIFPFWIIVIIIVNTDMCITTVSTGPSLYLACLTTVTVSLHEMDVGQFVNGVVVPMCVHVCISAGIYSL